MSLGYPQEILEFEYDPSFPVRLVKNMSDENGCNTRFKNVICTQLLHLQVDRHSSEQLIHSSLEVKWKRRNSVDLQMIDQSSTQIANN